jgi:hypothetical protein
MAILVLAGATSANVDAQTYSVLFHFNNSGGGTAATNAGPAFAGDVAQGQVTPGGTLKIGLPSDPDVNSTTAMAWERGRFIAVLGKCKA